MITSQKIVKHRQYKWWNRPLVGNKSMTERIIAFVKSLKRKEIPTEAIKLHRNAYKQSEILSQRVYTIDNEKFGNPEFLAFVRLKKKLVAGEIYQGLDRYALLLQAGLDAKSSFIALERIEFTFVSTKQRKFYQSVDALYSYNLEPKAFLSQVEAKYEEIYPQLRTEQGKAALQSYRQYLTKVCRHQLGYKLLCSFKKRRFSDFSILKKVSDIIDALKRDSIIDSDSLGVTVIENYELFIKLGQVIALPEHWNNTKIFTVLLQYIAFSEKYDRAFPRFQQLVGILHEWEHHYFILERLRHEHSPQRKYKPLKEFRMKIPGLAVYKRYHQYFI